MTAPDSPAGPDGLPATPSDPPAGTTDSPATLPGALASPSGSAADRPSSLMAAPPDGAPPDPGTNSPPDSAHDRTPVRIDHLADGAIRVEVAGEASPLATARVVALARAIREDDLPGVLDILPAYVTVVVIFDPATADPEAIESAVVRLASTLPETASTPAREVTLPVAYGGEDGPDLDDVARHVGLSPAAVVTRHAGETYTVACLGFAPGFPFLLGLPPDLATPRLTSPRTTTPVGSVAIGGVQTGVYPLATPGGWRIIGRTPVPLFDPAVADPFLLRPGDRLRFDPVEAATADAIAAQPDPLRAATVLWGIPDVPDVPDLPGTALVAPTADSVARHGAGAPAGGEAVVATDPTTRVRPGPPGAAADPDSRAITGPGQVAGHVPGTMATGDRLIPVGAVAGSFAVLEGGLLTTVQDLGRPGLEHLGVSAGGAVDRTALRLGNLLAGNDPAAAGLEITLAGPRLRLDADAGAVVVVAGADLGATVDGQSLPPWRPALVPPGGEIAFRSGGGAGARAYLCVAGGFDLPAVLSSRATDLTGRFGGLDGRALLTGDALPIGAKALPPDRLLRRRLTGAPPSLDAPARLAVVLGPQRHRFTGEGVAALLGGTFTASTRSDRMGVRLTGPAVTLAAGADMLSEGIAPGTIQVPGDGQPIALLRARQTVGGYPKVATVVTADLDRLAQVRPGDPVSFEAVDRHEARRRALAAHARWQDPIRDDPRPVQGIGRLPGRDAPGNAVVDAPAVGPGERDGDRMAPPRPPHAPDQDRSPSPAGPDGQDIGGPPAPVAPAPMRAWDPDGVVRVIRAAREAGVRSLRLRIGDLEVELRRDDGDSHEAAPSAAPGRSPGTGLPAHVGRTGDPAPGDDHPVATPPGPAVVRAPLLGLFYRRPSPADEPFVAVGQPVAVGQTIGLIEVMKTFNEVTADVAGTVAAFLVEDGQFVEYGAPLVEIDSSSGDRAGRD
ncbi:MAG: 5-oxoprolinase subunit PxpB [Chloroflexota bacterium]|nr:5-oxoprolinase subunit PxpB [Chloroflexota bacterium]